MAICYIGVDSFGNIIYGGRNPEITITPVVHPISIGDDEGKPLQDINGRPMSSFGHAMHHSPIRISEELFNEISANGPDKYMYNHAKGIVEKKL